MTTFMSTLLSGALVASAAFGQQISRTGPAQGPIAGGTIVTLTGSGFNATTLSSDGANIVPSSRTGAEIRFTTPPHDNVYALVSMASGANAVYTEFLYVPPKLGGLDAGAITTIGNGVTNWGHAFDFKPGTQVPNKDEPAVADR